MALFAQGLYSIHDAMLMITVAGERNLVIADSIMLVEVRRPQSIAVPDTLAWKSGSI